MKAAQARNKQPSISDDELGFIRKHFPKMSRDSQLTVLAVIMDEAAAHKKALARHAQTLPNALDGK